MEQVTYNQLYFDLWRKERLKELQEKSEDLFPNDPDYPFAKYMLMRGFAARFDFDQAFRIISLFTEPGGHNTLWADVFQIWSVYLELLKGSRVDIMKIIIFFKSRTALPDRQIYLKAIGNDLLSGIISYGISFGYLSANEKEFAISLAWESIQLYGEAGCDFEALHKKKNLIQLYRKRPYENKHAASALANELLAQGAGINDEIITGYAKLALAEIAFENIHLENVTQEILQSVITQFNEAEASFRNGGYVAAEALVNDRAGQLLLLYGYAEGLKCLHEAAEEYRQCGMLPNTYDCLLQISNWHLHHGNDDFYQEARKVADEVGSRFNTQLSAFISVMDQIESAYRSGRIGFGRDLHQKAVARFNGNHLRNQLDVLQANNLLKVNLHKEAIQIHREIVSRYEPLQVSSWLADAYYNLACQLVVTSPGEAKELLLKAIAMDEALNDRFESIRRILRYIEAVVQQQLKISKTISITNEITTAFEQAFLRLSSLRTYQAVQRTGEVLQTKGQAYFFSKQFAEARKYYKDAQQIFNASEFNANLGFLYTQESLLLIDEARSRGSIQFFDEALSLLQQAKTIFGKMGYALELSRFYFLTGVANYEAAKLETKPENVEQRYVAAELSFEDAYQLLSEQLQNIDFKAGVSRQRSMIAFVEEGVKIFEQAFNMNCFFTLDLWKALKWLDRMKSNALLQSMLVKEAEVKAIGHIQDQFLKIVQDSDLSIMIQQRLNADILILSYYCTRESVIVFGNRNSWDSPKMQVIDITHRDLSELQNRHFSTRFDGVFGMMRHHTEKSWQKFNKLIMPIASWSEPGELVYIVPHDVLHDFPIHCFTLQNGNYLIERNSIAYHFSISLLLHSSRNSTSENLFAEARVFGDSRNNLPFARQEAIAVSKITGATPLLGDEVTFESISDAIEKAKLIHISCHGEVSGADGFTYGLQLAGERIFTGSDLFKRTSGAELVVLSGCETGSSEKFTGDELMGLVRGFLYAGTATTIVSQWRVNDEKTAELFTAFYTYLSTISAGFNSAFALQQAMIELKRQGFHFFYWGAFKLIGNLT